MVEISSVESIDTLNLNQQFRLNKINEIKNYFISEIKERELISKRLASFGYFDKSFIVLSATSGSISIASFATVNGIPVGIASASLSLIFIVCRTCKKILKTTRNNNKKT